MVAVGPLDAQPGEALKAEVLATTLLLAYALAPPWCRRASPALVPGRPACYEALCHRRRRQLSLLPQGVSLPDSELAELRQKPWALWNGDCPRQVS